MPEEREAFHLRELPKEVIHAIATAPIDPEFGKFNCEEPDFKLDDKAYQRFMELLDAPAQVKPKLRALLARKAPWEK